MGNRPARLLIAEDDDAMRELLLQRLQTPDRLVIETEDGFELFDYLRACQLGGHWPPLPLPDLILTDLRMPGIDALEVLRRMRAEGISVPVVLLTAFSDQQVRDAARNLGACAVLDKPIDLDELQLAVSALLRDSQTATQRARAAVVP